jgi:transposase
MWRHAASPDPTCWAKILFEKFGQHQLRNRQSERYRREDIDLSLSTLADQVGTCTTVLQPLYALIERHVLLRSGCMATTRPCRSWPKARPWRGTSGLMCATIAHSGDARRQRRSITPRATAGMSIPRGTFTVFTSRRGKNAAAVSPIALEAVKRIDVLFDTERGINGQCVEECMRVRREQSAPLLAELEGWLRDQRARQTHAELAWWLEPYNRL